MSRGKFITLEGIDGAGKSTQVATVAEWLRARGREVVVTREPGGTSLGEALRSLLLSRAMHIDTEALLMFAARREHVAGVIEPALAAGRWVVSDRFTDASYAYQGGGGGLAPGKLAQLEQWALGDLRPDLTLVFDVPVEVARARLGEQGADRFEKEGAAFFQRVRKTYLDRAAAEPGRMRVVDAARSPEDIKKSVEEVLSTIW